MSPAARWWLRAVALVVGGSGLLVGLALAVNVAKDRAGRSQPCRLDVIAEVIDRDAPLFQATGKTSTDVIGLRSRDTLPWTDVVLAVYGFETAAGARTVTGRFERRVEDIEPGAIRAAELNEFRQPDGRRWSSLTMQASELEVTATRSGARCTGTISLPAQ
jgi:hypothetical protein